MMIWRIAFNRLKRKLCESALWAQKPLISRQAKTCLATDWSRLGMGFWLTKKNVPVTPLVLDDVTMDDRRYIVAADSARQKNLDIIP